MGDGQELSRHDVRMRLKAEVAASVLAAMDRGWTVRVQGHGVRLYCPCGQHGGLSVAGTPASPSNEARRIRRFVARVCWP